MIKKLPLLLIIACSFNAVAQDTYTKVYNMLQAKCTGCHNPGQPDGLVLTGSDPATVYAALVNTNPVNTTALAKHNKVVSPGDPFRSFLYRKINNGLDTYNHLDNLEGNQMLDAGSQALSNYEVELVRQWILMGAPQTGDVVDTAVINTFYTVGGITSLPAIPAAPLAGEGKQFHVGRFFLPPASEREYFLKFDPMLGQDIEINRVHVFTPYQNHHFVIYKFFPGADAGYAAGLRNLDQTSHGSGDGLSGGGAGEKNLVLPEGTAFLVSGSTVFDYNMHIVNNSPDSVMAFDIYYNIYTQPEGTANHYMYMRNFPHLDLAIPHDNQEHTFTGTAYDEDGVETNMWKVWGLYTHTHRYGTDFDIYMRNLDGSQGEQLYEGFYNHTYTFNQGYYSWSIGEVAEKYYEEPYLEIDPRKGFIQQAKFKNTAGPDTVYFGSTSLDEMMIMGMLYYYGDPIPTGIEENKDNPFIIYPNPGKGDFTLQFNENTGNEMIFIQVMNALGQSVKELSVAGTGSGNVALDLNQLAKGIYVVKVFSGKEFYSQKLVIE